MGRGKASSSCDKPTTDSVVDGWNSHAPAVTHFDKPPPSRAQASDDGWGQSSAPVQQSCPVKQAPAASPAGPGPGIHPDRLRMLNQQGAGTTSHQSRQDPIRDRPPHMEVGGYGAGSRGGYAGGMVPEGRGGYAAGGGGGYEDRGGYGSRSSSAQIHAPPPPLQQQQQQMVSRAVHGDDESRLTRLSDRPHRRLSQ